MDPIEGKLLGKQISYPQKYSPDILVAVPRYLNREIYNLQENSLPFIGKDIWHAYELSFLTDNGLPVAGLLKIAYSANSTFLVESKSLKLYLNSFNMEHFGANADEGISRVTAIIRKDLTELLKTEVQLQIFNDPLKKTGSLDFQNYKLLEKLPEVNHLKFESFTETPTLLSVGKTTDTTMKVTTNLLRSNCKITHQPDWGTAFIYLKGNQIPDTSNLLKYLVSIRNENHFHEEICEMIYKRLLDTFSPDELMVSCIYTRRGGIDICPVRVSHEKLLPTVLCDVNVLSEKLLRQ